MPVVLDVPEILALIDKLSPAPRLMAEVQYGAGLRVSEVVSLRIKDVDIARGMVTIRCGKGDVDRVTVLPNVLKERLVLGIRPFLLPNLGLYRARKSGGKLRYPVINLRHSGAPQWQTMNQSLFSVMA